MLKKSIRTLSAAALVALAAGAAPALAQDKSIIVQSTTSTENSGLFKHLLPIFEKKTGIKVRVVAVGTGQAIKNAANGDADVLLVHAKSAEEKFVKDGWGVERFDLMYNDYIVVGPPTDSAKVGGMKDAKEAFKRIAAAQAAFLSRGDNSGTHKAELVIWEAAVIDPRKASGKWYREAGSGMGATLNTGVGMGAYVLADRGTWISFKNKGDHKIQVEGAKDLFNQYGVVLVNPKRHPKVKAKKGQAFIDWLLGPDGQKAIADFKLAGKQLFFPNAKSRKST